MIFDLDARLSELDNWQDGTSKGQKSSSTLTLWWSRMPVFYKTHRFTVWADHSLSWKADIASFCWLTLSLPWTDLPPPPEPPPADGVVETPYLQPNGMETSGTSLDHDGSASSTERRPSADHRTESAHPHSRAASSRHKNGEQKKDLDNGQRRLDLRCNNF